MKKQPIEAFIKTFNRLVKAWNISTDIGLDDGRPFTYEVDYRFNAAFGSQALEWTLPSYDSAVFSEYGGEEGTFVFATLKNSDIASKERVLRLRKVDWLNKPVIAPSDMEWLDKQTEFLKKIKQLDFEIRFEKDLIASHDLNYVALKLKERARMIMELTSIGQYVAEKRHTIGLSGKLNLTSDAELDEMVKKRPFDLGMLLPLPVEDTSQSRTLEAKWEHLSEIEKNNEELKKLEEEMLKSDPNSAGLAVSKIVTPVVASVFAEHEVTSFMQLRYLKLRELRSTLLRQMNFFRSIQKRIVNDYDPNWEKATTSGDFSDVLSSSKWWDISLANAFLQKVITDDHLETPEKLASKTNITKEDYRLISNSRIYIKDSKGVSFIYDAAVDDLKNLETELAKIATHYINNSAGGAEDAPESLIQTIRKQFIEKNYGEEMSLLNTEIDREQLLLDLYEHEVKFQYAKILLINSYMDVYEHTVNPSYIRKLMQIVTDFIRLRPHFVLDDSYFSRSYNVHTEALETQADLVISMVQSTIERDRALRISYFDRVEAEMPSPAKSKSQPNGDDLDNQDKLDGNLFDAQGPGVNSTATPNTANDSQHPSIPIPNGLPCKLDRSEQMVTMNSAAVSVYMTEVVPALEKVVDLHAIAADMLVPEFQQSLGYVQPKEKSWRAAFECVIWRNLKTLWNLHAENDFALPFSKHSMGTFVDNFWVDSPILPDLMLRDTFLVSQEWAGKTTLEKKKIDALWGISNLQVMDVPIPIPTVDVFHSPEYQMKGLMVLNNLVKTIVSRNRLMYSWVETELLRPEYAKQASMLGVTRKGGLTGRLEEIQFKRVLSMENTEGIEEEEFQYYEDMEHSTYAGMKCWPLANGLAFGEIQENFGVFRFEQLDHVIAECSQKAIVQRLSKALRVSFAFLNISRILKF